MPRGLSWHFINHHHQPISTHQSACVCIVAKRPPSPNRFTDSPIGIKLTIITNQCKIYGHLTMNKRKLALQWLVTVAVLLLLRGMGYRETRPEGSMAQFFQAINIRFIESPPRPMIFHVSEVVNNRQIHSYILHCFIYSTSNLLPLHRTHKYPKWVVGLPCVLQQQQNSSLVISLTTPEYLQLYIVLSLLLLFLFLRPYPRTLFHVPPTTPVHINKRGVAACR